MWFSLFFLKLPTSLKSNKLKLKRILTYFPIVEKIGRKKPCQVRCLLWFTTCGERFLGISHWQKTERTLKENKIGYGSLSFFLLQVNNYEIVVKIFHISHTLTWYSTIVHKFTRIYPVCSTYGLTKQFM